MSAAACLDNLPRDLINAVARDAERDAGLVGTFLDRLGLRPPPGQALSLPAAFLLDLGAALRLLVWEHDGLEAPAVAELPPARQALRDVLLSLRSDATGARRMEAPATLAPRVLSAFADHFAWPGRPELDADVTLEEAVLEALADFLWTHRPS